MIDKLSIIKQDNYLVLDCDRMGYKLRMLEANRIPGLLPVEVHEADDNKKLYYDISSKETFDSIVSTRTLQMDDIRNLVFSLNRTLKKIDDYLLDAADLILDRRYIYISGDRLEPVFCCYPGYGGDFQSGLSSLLQDLLGMVDSNDRSAVVSTYALYQASLKPGYGISDLIRVINTNTAEIESEKKKTSEESVQYKDDVVEVVSVKTAGGIKTEEIDDEDELYTSLNADPRKYHFGSRNRRQEEDSGGKRKKGLGLFR